MRKRILPWLLFTMAFLFSAYTNLDRNTSQSGTPNQSINTDTPSTVESAVPTSNKDDLYETYADVSSLAALDISMDETYIFDDRTLLLEDSVDNEIERLAFEYYYDICSAEFETLADLVGGNKALQIAVDKEQDLFNRGYYMSEYTIHELATLTVDDLQHISEFSVNDILSKMDALHFDEFAIVKVDVSWKHNEASLSQGPQLGDGRYDRYYLFAKTIDVPAFKMYEVYWEDFLVA